MTAFPAIPGIEIDIKKTSVYATTTQVAASGKEQRAAWMDSPRYMFEMTLTARENANIGTSSVSEYAAIQNLFDECKGSWGTFTFPDPVSTATYTCRFDQDVLEWERVVDHWWRTTLRFITVL